MIRQHNQSIDKRQIPATQQEKERWDTESEEVSREEDIRRERGRERQREKSRGGEREKRR